jgi:pyruvate formate lyase activating enzyme
VTVEDVYAHLEKRKSVLGGLAISGGEPLLSPALQGLVSKARALGLAVKIDTNGTLPDRLASILGDPAMCPDMIAIDVKTSPARYGELATEPTQSPALGNALLASLEILARKTARFPAGNDRQLRIEYRTVLVPGLVGENEIRDIGRLIPHDADWEFAPFHPGTCLDPALNDLAPYGPEETKRLVAIARELRPGARLR